MMKNERNASMAIPTAGDGFDYTLFTWHPKAKVFLTEISTLTANCKNGIPFLLVNGRVAVRIKGRRSTKDFLWVRNILDQEGEHILSEYVSGDLTLHILND